MLVIVLVRLMRNVIVVERCRFVHNERIGFGPARRLRFWLVAMLGVVVSLTFAGAVVSLALPIADSGRRRFVALTSILRWLLLLLLRLIATVAMIALRFERPTATATRTVVASLWTRLTCRMLLLLLLVGRT